MEACASPPGIKNLEVNTFKGTGIQRCYRLNNIKCRLQVQDSLLKMSIELAAAVTEMTTGLPVIDMLKCCWTMQGY